MNKSRIKPIHILLPVAIGLVIAGLWVFATPTQKASITAPVQDGLVAYWNMDSSDIYGTTLYDKSGYGNHGTIHGATTATGKIKQALSFDGVSDYVEVPHSSSLNITDAITLEAWLYDPPLNEIQNSNIKNQNDNSKLKELEITEIKDNKYAFKTLDGSVIEIGTEEHSPPQPYLNLIKWDGEVSMKVGIPFETGKKPIVMGDKIRYSTQDKPLAQSWWQKLTSIFTVRADDSQPRIDIDFYPKQPEEITENINGQERTFKIFDDGGVKFDTILYEKPETNKIIFPIEIQGLKFYYQPELTQEEKDKGAFRPEHIIGSYAVYHESKQGDYTALGGKNYKTGKAFHIYRPLIFDAQGNEIWGELKIDEKAGVLTVTVDQGWLNKAIYPVTVDPTFGHTSVGGTSSVGSIEYIEGTWGETGVAGVAATIHAYTHMVSGEAVTKGAIYAINEDLVDGGTSETNVTTARAWYEFDLTGSNLAAATEYGATWWQRVNMYGYRDSVTDAGFLRALSYGDWPDPAGYTLRDFRFSIYATYEPPPPKVIVGKGQDAYQLEVQVEADDSLNALGYINDYKAVTAPITIAWHHVVLTYDGSDVRLYIDGVEKDSYATTTAINTNLDNLKIGEKFIGEIDEVRIYNRALSVSEVSQNYNSAGRMIIDTTDEERKTIINPASLEE